MVVHGRIFDRRSFLAALGLENHAFNQRAYRGEIALAFGLSKPGHVNEYGELEVFAVMLTFLSPTFSRSTWRTPQAWCVSIGANGCTA
jgi:hypothetical protein